MAKLFFHGTTFAADLTLAGLPFPDLPHARMENPDRVRFPVAESGPVEVGDIRGTPGDRWCVTSVKPGATHAEASRVLEPAPAKVEPPRPYLIGELVDTPFGRGRVYETPRGDTAHVKLDESRHVVACRLDELRRAEASPFREQLGKAIVDSWKAAHGGPEPVKVEPPKTFNVGDRVETQLGCGVVVGHVVDRYGTVEVKLASSSLPKVRFTPAALKPAREATPQAESLLDGINAYLSDSAASEMATLMTEGTVTFSGFFDPAQPAGESLLTIELGSPVRYNGWPSYVTACAPCGENGVRLSLRRRTPEADDRPEVPLVVGHRYHFRDSGGFRQTCVVKGAELGTDLFESPVRVLKIDAKAAPKAAEADPAAARRERLLARLRASR